MIKKTLTYESFDGLTTITEDFYFHLSKLELMAMEFSTAEGFQAYMTRAIKNNDRALLIATIMEMVSKAYGVRSEDNKAFIKSDELRRNFEGTMAFDNLVFELLTDEKKGEAFFNGVVPAGMLAAVKAKNPDLVEGPLLNEDDPKPWLTQNREPTPKEVRGMSREDLVEAMGRKVAREMGFEVAE